MRSALTFLVITKRCEIAELEQLARTCELVGITGRLVHGLQLERGLSCRYLGSNGAHFAASRLAQIAACEPLQADLCHWVDLLEAQPAPPASRARLYSRIAWAQQGLEALAGLRTRITMLEYQAGRAGMAFRRLIAALLTIVFEAADGSPDPEVSRLLVAIFHLMQAKEFAAQESAIGAAMLATGVIVGDEQQRLLRLIESQQRCQRIVQTFVAADRLAAAFPESAQDGKVEQEGLRQVLLTCPIDKPLPTARAALWFEVCTQRMEAMKQGEDLLVAALQTLCQNRIRDARADLERSISLVGASNAGDASEAGPGDPGRAAASGLAPELAPGLATRSADRSAPSTRLGSLQFFDSPAADGLPSPDPLWGDGDEGILPLEQGSGQPVLDLVGDQSRRLQTTKAELDRVRATLNERKLIERAKGLLMAHRKLTEAQAHRALRQLAMNQSRRLVDVAEAVLTTSVMLAERPTLSS